MKYPLSLLIVLAPAVAAAAPEVTPAGDGGGVRVTLVNATVHPMEAGVGPADGAPPHLPVPGYGEAPWFVQCVDGSSGPAPRLQAGPVGAMTPIAVPPVAFPAGAPALFIGHRGPERTAVAGALGEQGPPLESIAPEQVPTTFAALRFAPLILVSAADLSRLSPEARDAVRGAVVAGSTLVVAGGDGAGADELLAGLAPVRFGEPARPGAALRHALPACTGRVELVPGAGARATVVADGAPVVVEVPLGLGRVRVTSVRFGDLERGAVADALFGLGEDPLGALLGWLEQRPPLAPHQGAPFAAWTWALPLALALLGLLARRRPVTALLLGAAPVTAAAFLSPVGATQTIDEGVVLYVPVAGEALAIGTVDLTLVSGGGRFLEGWPAMALEDASPRGACLASGPGAAWWILGGEPGERRRLAFFARLQGARAEDVATRAVGEASANLPAWPAGPLAGLPLRPLEGEAPVPFPAAPGVLAAWRVDLTGASASEPVVLEAGTEGAAVAPPLP